MSGCVGCVRLLVGKMFVQVPRVCTCDCQHACAGEWSAGHVVNLSVNEGARTEIVLRAVNQPTNQPTN